MELTPTFMALLEGFVPVFTLPSFATFQLLMAGWILSVRHRFVTELILSSDSVGNGHFSDYHRFFSEASWDINKLWKSLAQLVIETLVGEDATIVLAADDTLCRKRGLKLFGAGMHHDPLISSRAMRLVSWGHDWVILSVVVAHPRWAPSKVFALPICARLYRNKQGLAKKRKPHPQRSKASSATAAKKAAAGSQPRAKRKPAKLSHQTRPELLTEMLQLIAEWFPHRRFHVVVDSAYSGRSVLRHLPDNMDLTGPVHPTGILYEPASPSKSGKGRRRKKGPRLPSRDEWATDGARWQKLKFDQYGLHSDFQVKTRQGLYYTAGGNRLLKFVLSQDANGQRPTQIFYTTDVTQSAQQTLSRFSCRWSTEVMHFDVKQHLGFEDPANRKEKAVQRTAPMALFLYSLVIVWFAKEGSKHVRFPHRPWYPSKNEPSFADMLTTLRRVTWDEKLTPVRKKDALDENPMDLLIFLATLAG